MSNMDLTLFMEILNCIPLSCITLKKKKLKSSVHPLSLVSELIHVFHSSVFSCRLSQVFAVQSCLSIYTDPSIACHNHVHTSYKPIYELCAFKPGDLQRYVSEYPSKHFIFPLP